MPLFRRRDRIRVDHEGLSVIVIVDAFPQYQRDPFPEGTLTVALNGMALTRVAVNDVSVWLALADCLGQFPPVVL